MALLALPIVLYSARFSALGARAYPPDLAESFARRPWLIWLHVTAGPIALAAGPLQFLPALRGRWPAWHRRIGTAYVAGAAVLGGAGLALACFSAGGPVTHVGFGALAVGVLVTTGVAYRKARRHEYDIHRRWMVRSFALIYAAVTLRILLPMLVVAMHGEFLPGYRIVSWMCWVPNLLFAEWYLRDWRMTRTA